MKKILIAIAMSFGIVSTSSAVSVDWTSTALSFGGTNLKSLSSGVTGYLLYLGKNGNLNASYTIDDSFDATKVGTIVDTKEGTSKASKVFDKYSFDFGTKVNDDAFALLVSYTKDNVTYWNLSSVVNKLAGLSDETSTPEFSDFTMVNTPTDVTTIGNTLSAGGGWAKAATAVPEPGTAALALLGIGMLIKRRRA